ncbi:putative transporter [Smittium culicis]|uniref:Putative transporter n=1 Tax=Smittium culicis TaxID=133412 RepID=A0A1R1X9M2_9FUNG|nr:putative transporter [Smittium culicis]OMJ11316.1 putative transporter [Smittium culicis]
MTFINFTTFSLGLATFLFNWVMIVILDVYGIEEFVFPNLAQSLSITANSLSCLIYNSCFIIAIALSSPALASVGVMITIPLIVIVDIFVEGTKIQPYEQFKEDRDSES